ncbi:hypothetical protein [Caldimonas sp. KR1-144]|uniref:hypothetical protein n=1 Tax=Caldimonas sp. KR1-144 TaxID=3400911 RepID=UPI003BFFD04E
MSQSGSRPPPRTPPRVVPTLTEVVGRAGAPAPELASPMTPPTTPATARAPSSRTPQPPARTAEVPAAPAAVSAIDEEALVQRVLAEAMRQAGPIVERRLRLALAPALARLADAFVQNARDEITRSVQEALAKALDQELARRKPR